MTDRLVLPQPAAALVLAGVITAYGFDTTPTVTCGECGGNAVEPLVATPDIIAEAFIRGMEAGAERPDDAGDGDAMGQAFRAWRCQCAAACASCHGTGTRPLAVGPVELWSEGARLGTVNITAIIPTPGGVCAIFGDAP